MSRRVIIIIALLLLSMLSCRLWSFSVVEDSPSTYVVMYQEYDGKKFYAFDNYTGAQEEALKNSPAWIYRLYSKTVSFSPKTVIESIEWKEGK